MQTILEQTPSAPPTTCRKPKPHAVTQVAFLVLPSISLSFTSTVRNGQIRHDVELPDCVTPDYSSDIDFSVRSTYARWAVMMRWLTSTIFFSA
jgi:hypothetical protein